jgi:hypothetical protein
MPESLGSMAMLAYLVVEAAAFRWHVHESAKHLPQCPLPDRTVFIGLFYNQFLPGGTEATSSRALPAEGNA